MHTITIQIDEASSSITTDGGPDVNVKAGRLLGPALTETIDELGYTDSAAESMAEIVRAPEIGGMLRSCGFVAVKINSRTSTIMRALPFAADQTRDRIDRLELALSQIAAIVAGHDPDGVTERVPGPEDIVRRVGLLAANHRDTLADVCRAASIEPVIREALGDEIRETPRTLAQVCEAVATHRKLIDASRVIVSVRNEKDELIAKMSAALLECNPAALTGAKN